LSFEGRHSSASLSARLAGLDRGGPSASPRGPTRETAPPKEAPKEARKSSRLKQLAFAAFGLFALWAIVTKSFGIYIADVYPKSALLLDSGAPQALLNIAEARLAADARFQTLPPVVRRPADQAAAQAGSTPAASAPANGAQPAPPKDAQPAAAPNAAQGAATGGKDGPAAPSSDAPAAPGGPVTEAEAKSYDETSALIERALLRDPLNSRGFRMLGQLSATTPNDERTKKLMEAAVRRSLLENVALYWLTTKSFDDKDYARALAYADVLLRTTPRSALWPLMPMFGRLAETPAANVELKELLETNPPWRERLLQNLSGTITDARTPLDILLALKQSGTPPNRVELGAYLKFLVDHKFYDLAYYTWLQFLPEGELGRTGYLFNGDFEKEPTGSPFDWTFAETVGVRYGFEPRPDKPDSKALKLDFGPGRVDYRDVAQITTLAPGTYEFSGTYKSRLSSTRGMIWRVDCAGKSGGTAGESEPVTGDSAIVKEFAFTFTVPETDCPAQSVRLLFDARSASERFITGNIWYDDLKITRVLADQAATDTGQK
jgi:hypothetical protein